MTGEYEYFVHTSYLDCLSIDNIGECCLEANNDLGEVYYLCISTNLGQTKVLEYGPYIDGLPPINCYESFTSFSYSERKIDKIIKKFLCNPARNITQAREVLFSDIQTNLVNPKEYFQEDGYIN